MTAIKDKVAHVNATRQSRVHTCHWPGCQTLVPPAVWGCKTHWYQLPLTYRNRIWAAYRPGQEVDMRPSEDYVAIAEAVQAWIKEQG